MTDTIAIFPARGGSKRIPRKNIRPFCDRPALAWPLAAAQGARLFDRIILTTDDAEIAAAGRDLGFEVPFLRAADLADDHTGTTDVIRDAVTRLELPDDAAVCCIYSTAFFLAPEDLRSGHARLAEGARWALALSPYRSPIERAYRMDGHQARARDPAMMPRRSQDLEQAYFDAGQFYWARAATWRDRQARVWDGAAGVEIPAHRAIDIDTPEDWALAEMMMRAQNAAIDHDGDAPDAAALSRR